MGLVATTKALAACRVMDLDLVHCSIPIRARGSPNVFLGTGTSAGFGNIVGPTGPVIPGYSPWSRMGDVNHPHLLPCGVGCCVHLAPIAKGSSKVFVNGRGAGRVTDYVLACTAVATGTPTVFVGG